AQLLRARTFFAVAEEDGSIAQNGCAHDLHRDARIRDLRASWLGSGRGHVTDRGCGGREIEGDGQAHDVWLPRRSPSTQGNRQPRLTVRRRGGLFIRRSACRGVTPLLRARTYPEGSRP